MAPRYPGAAFVEAARYNKAANSNGTVTRIVIHDMEMAESNTTAESCARMFHTTSRQASAHFCVDSDSVVQCVDLDRRAFHAPPNTGSIGIEQAGFAKQTRAQWLDPYGNALLSRSAAVTAWLCLLFDIPVVRLSAAQLRAGRHGLCGHADVSQAFGQTDHTDPGVHFPWDWYLDKVKSLLPATSPTEAAPVESRPPQKWSDPVTVKDPVTKKDATVLTHVDYWIPIGFKQKHAVAVTAIQYWLNRNGSALQLDGDFGEKTLLGVRRYQAKVGLTVDGIVGPVNAARLGIVKKA